MIALPSIAFGGFSGSAKDVTARQVGGRSILSVRTWPTGQSTSIQVARRASLARITKSYKLLTQAQMLEWEKLAEHSSGQSVFGQKAQLSGINMYVRLNANRAMAGESLITDAPQETVIVPDASYEKIIVTPELILFLGIDHLPSPNKLVVKMSSPQSPGISNGWSKTVIISSEVEDDWGEADVTTLYLKTIGVEPVPGQKVFVETYWMDTSTGFTGPVLKGSASVITMEEAIEQGYAPRKRVDMNNIDLERSQVRDFDMDFSTGAPLLNHEGVVYGEPGYAAAYVYPNDRIEGNRTKVSFCLGRGTTADGKLLSQSLICYISDHVSGTEITYSHRGGKWSENNEVWGPGIMYEM